ncbi:hypothetical protein ACLOJK_030292, partial [Asimina triloba]
WKMPLACPRPYALTPASRLKIRRVVSISASGGAFLRSNPASATTKKMAHSVSSQQPQGGDSEFQQQTITIPNNQGEKLVGILYETGSRELVILCHGFQSSKESKPIASLAVALTREGISTFRFDFSGNG